MLEVPESLVLPFLDKEFQEVSQIPQQLVSDYCIFSLIAAPRLIASPSFFAESAITRTSILSSSAFYGTAHVQLSLREPNLDVFFRKKQPNYTSWRHEPQYEGYYTTAEQLINTLRLPIRHRSVHIGEAIARSWRRAAQSMDAFSFSHMTNALTDAYARKAVLQALGLVPDELRGAPFIWQSVCSILDRYEPRWRVPEFESMLRSYLLKCYFEALCEPGDSMVAFSDFHNIYVADSTFARPLIPLSPLRLFLTSAGVMDILRRNSVEDLLGIANSTVCHDFRYRYFEILAAGKQIVTSFQPSDGLLHLSYAKAIEWCRMLSQWVGCICREAGKDARRRRQNWSVRALLDDTVARGFVDSLKRTSKEMDLIQRTYAKDFLTCQVHSVNVYNMRDNYHANAAGVIGPGAQGNHITQSIFQDERRLELAGLAKELAQLRLVMEQAASAPEHHDCVRKVAQAEIEAKAGDQSKTMELLKSAGRWTLEQAIKIGLNAACDAIKKSLGLPSD